MHNKQLEKTKNNKMKKRIKQILSVSLTILVSTMLVAGVATAVTTLSENIATGGTLTVTGTSTLTGATTVTGALYANGAMTLGDAAADVVTVTGTIAGASPLVFEGLTVNDFELTFAITDPTAARTITFPDVTGTVMVGATSTTATQALFATTTAGAPAFRAIALNDLPAQTGTGSIVLATSPTIVTPTINGNLTLGPATSHMISSQTTAPLTTGSTCTTPAIAAGSTDTRGNASAASCTESQTVVVVFNTVYASAPNCVVSPSNAAAAPGGAVAQTFASASTTALTITSPAVATTAPAWDYICIQ